MVRPDGLSWRSTRPKCNGRWRIARPKTAPTLGTRARTRGFPSAQRGRPCCNATRTRAPDPAQPCGALSWAPARPTARPSADDQCACACHVRVAKVRRRAMLVAHAGSRPFPAPWWLARRQPKAGGPPLRVGRRGCDRYRAWRAGMHAPHPCGPTARNRVEGRPGPPSMTNEGCSMQREHIVTTPNTSQATGTPWERCTDAG